MIIGDSPGFTQSAPLETRLSLSFAPAITPAQSEYDPEKYQSFLMYNPDTSNPVRVPWVDLKVVAREWEPSRPATPTFNPS